LGYATRVARDDLSPRRDDDGRQRIARRNAAFVLLPTCILVLLSCDLIWEVARSNVSESTRSHWPWRLSLLGVAPAAGLAGVLGGLLLARGQFARSVRPALGWTANNTSQSSMIGDRSRWTVYLFNGGAGLATVSRIRYSVVLGASIDCIPDKAWLDFRSTMKTLRAASLSEGEDFAIFNLGEGAALPAVKGPSDGVELAALGERCLSRLRAFDIWIQVTDTVGDTHERVLRCLEPLGREDEEENGS
jgi:hypothetical protein